MRQLRKIHNPTIVIFGFDYRRVGKGVAIGIDVFHNGNEIGRKPHEWIESGIGFLLNFRQVTGERIGLNFQIGVVEKQGRMASIPNVAVDFPLADVV